MHVLGELAVHPTDVRELLDRAATVPANIAVKYVPSGAIAYSLAQPS